MNEVAAIKKVENQLGIPKTLKLKVYNDPGHGWLAVPLRTYIKSGVQASRYSYVNRNRTIVYLEEDCDAGLFIVAMKAIGVELVMTSTHTNRQSRIRSMDSIIEVHTKSQIISDFASVREAQDNFIRRR